MTKPEAEAALIEAGFTFRPRDYWVAPETSPYVRAIVRETAPNAFKVAAETRGGGSVFWGQVGALRISLKLLPVTL